MLILVYLVCAQGIWAEGNPIAYTTTVVLNGEVMTANFNDGDTFKIQDGSYAKSRVRVAGYNALENVGKVHLFADSSAEYLFEIANKATQLARNGKWHCVTEGEKDRYGRIVATCDDLAIALIEAGYAHAYSMDETPAERAYIRAQKKAQRGAKGMWKYGIPEYIITSLHSADEGAQKTYNRLISTADGHTEQWFHEDSYETCEIVCADDDSCMVYVPFEERYGSNRAECLR